VPTNLQLVHTADLDTATLKRTRALLDLVFGDEMTDDDWEHALGGMHALVWEDDDLVGHASVVQRRLLHADRAWRTGYVEGVAVHPECRRRGHAGAMMDEVERIIRGAYQVGALGSTDQAAAFYAARGWQAWQGTTWGLTPEGRVRTQDDDGGIYVFEVNAPLDISAELTCDWREGSLW
jgi:aminoglycoside 2'-N-acetyltransferase I